MPVPDQVQDDGCGIQNILKLLDSKACPGLRSGVRRNDGPSRFRIFYEAISIVTLTLPCYSGRVV